MNEYELLVQQLPYFTQQASSNTRARTYLSEESVGAKILNKKLYIYNLTYYC